MISRLSTLAGPLSSIFRPPVTEQATNGIVLPNLQLYLTAGDTDSYPGSGTTWTDLSTNAYSATLTNGVGYTSSDANGTLTFDGSNDYVDTNQSLSSEEFTIGGWFKLTASGYNMIISKEESAGSPWNYRLYLSNGSIIGDIAKSSSSNSIQTPLSSYNDGDWYQVMFTRDSNDMYLYVNGSQVATAANTLSGSITNSQEVWIGISAFLGGSYAFNGKISEIMIYNRALTSAEILQNFNATQDRFFPLVTFSQTFTGGVAPSSSIENAWTLFRSQLTGSYTTMTISNSLGNSITVTNASVQNIANALRTATTGTNFSVTIGANTWRVLHGCVAGSPNSDSIYLTNGSDCACNGTYTIRPMIKNSNWGGINSSSCGSPTQTISISFS